MKTRSFGRFALAMAGYNLPETCTQCAIDSEAGAKVCSRCGNVLDYKVRSRLIVGPHPQLIFSMWILTLGYFIFTDQRMYLLAAICSLSSLCLGIYLITCLDNIDKLNGCIRVAISVVIAIAVFVVRTQ